jgi:integrase
MTLDHLFTLYRAKRLLFKSANTARLYTHTIRNFARTIGHPPTLDDLTNDAVELHMSTILQRGGSPASANKDRSQLLSLWRFATTNRILDRWPDVQQANEPEAVPLGWLPEDLDKLLATVDADRSLIGRIPAKLFWAALFRTLLATGERIGAIMPLQWHHLQGDWLLVPAEHRKGKRRDRLYPLGADAAEACRKLIAANLENDRIFPFPYSATYLYKKLTAVLKRAGLPTDRKSKYHRFRRTVASAVARAGGDPTRALDHASPKTTKKYLDPRIVGSVPVADILAAYLANPRPAAAPPTPNQKTG